MSTLHVDSFLYPSEDDVDELLGALGIGRYHCLECGSWKTSPLGKKVLFNIISSLLFCLKE